MNDMAIKTHRTLCTTAEVARVFGVTMGRIRQMALAGELWYTHLGDHCLVFDRDEVDRKAKEREEARASGKARGPKPGGFKKERAVSKARMKKG